MLFTSLPFTEYNTDNRIQSKVNNKNSKKRIMGFNKVWDSDN